MDAVKKNIDKALVVGEKIVDRHPHFCLRKYMKGLEDKYGFSRAGWFMGVFSLVSLMLYLIGGLSLIANLIGFMYPAFASFKAIDSPDALASQQLLSYWAIFGAFFTFENGFPFVVSSIPYYSILKGLVLVYCFHPASRGATHMYDALIRPLVIKHVIPGTASAQKEAAKDPSPADTAAFSESASPSGGQGGEMNPFIASSSSPGLASSTSRGAPAVTVPSDSAREQRVLRLVVMSANDVVTTDAPGSGVDCDPYCVLEVLPEGPRAKQGAAENTKYKTVCKTGTANPVWNEGVTIPNVVHMDAKLVVTVCNKRAMGRDECLGKIEVPLSRLQGSEASDMVMSLMPADEDSTSASGELRIQGLLV